MPSSLVRQIIGGITQNGKKGKSTPDEIAKALSPEKLAEATQKEQGTKNYC